MAEIGNDKKREIAEDMYVSALQGAKLSKI